MGISNKTFKGGVYPPHKKSYSAGAAIKTATLPSQVIIPLSQHTGKQSKPIVKAGDHVDIGTKIAEATGFISTNQHSSISGTVKQISAYVHPIIGVCESILIESDGKDSLDVAIKAESQKDFNLTDTLQGLNPERIINAVFQAGIVGMGGAAFPTHVKLSPPKEKKIDTIIINGAECEPYLTCDHRLMLEHGEDILEGAQIMCKALGVDGCIVAIEDNKADAIEIMQKNVCIKSEIRNPKSETNPKSKIQNPKQCIRTVKVKTKYPQGAEKQLIKALLDREVPSGGLPFDVGVVVQNVGTAFAVYEAVKLGKPLFERVVTISGDCVKKPSNLLVRIGTPVSKLIEDCGGFVKEPAKVIFGGPMMGISQWTLDVPILKGTSGVLFLSKDALVLEGEGVCIRCGSCITVCPMNLIPTTIYAAADKDKFDIAEDYNCTDCIECGACSYECPAKLDLVGMIKYAKLKIRKD